MFYSDVLSGCDARLQQAACLALKNLRVSAPSAAALPQGSDQRVSAGLEMERALELAITEFFGCHGPKRVMPLFQGSRRGS